MSPTNVPPTPKSNWAYFLDLDGTLIEIAARPDAVRIDAPLLDLLGRLKQVAGGALALISGRSLADLDSRLGTLAIPMAGQHGLERRDSQGRVWSPARPAVWPRLQARLQQVQAQQPGLLLEDKGLTLALHYRGQPHLAAYVQESMAEVLAQAGPGYELQVGKRVVELKPAGIDKGTAITSYLGEPPFAGRRPLFIGDDDNDEPAFAAVSRMGGVAIKVGPEPTIAQYRLPDIVQVRGWLTRLVMETI